MHVQVEINSTTSRVVCLYVEAELFQKEGKILTGIDVSKHNGAVNWTSAPAAIDFAIIRAGYGKTYVDPWFERHLAGAQTAGLRVGVYHYSYALTVEDARAEARHLLSISNGRRFDMPLWFDMEDADGYKKKHGFTFSRANISAITQAFIDTIRAAGYQCGVYASKSWFEDYISVDADAIWLAQWASKPTYTGKFDVWQNSDSGTVPGVTGKVDTNVLYTEFWKEQEEDEEMKVYTHTDQMPDWAQSTFYRLIDAGIVKVDAKGEINVEHSALQPMVYLDRLCSGHIEQLLQHKVKI